MDDPIWRKVSELTKGYPPEFNAAAAAELVEQAWRMGFDLVKAPAGSDLYNVAMRERANLMRNAVDHANMAQSLHNAAGNSKY